MTCCILFLGDEGAVGAGHLALCLLVTCRLPIGAWTCGARTCGDRLAHFLPSPPHTWAGKRCPAVRGPGGPTVLSCLSLCSQPDLVALTAGAALLKNVSSRARPPRPFLSALSWASGLRQLLLYVGACFLCGDCLTRCSLGLFSEECDVVNDTR